MERSHVLGMQHRKIRAKTTMNVQPMDLGKKFKCIKSENKSISTQETDCSLRKVMTAGLDNFQNEGRFILVKTKRICATDCATSSPKAHKESHSFDSTDAAFYYCRFVSKIDAFPDVHAVMRASNDEFSSNPKLKMLFVNSVFECTL